MSTDDFVQPLPPSTQTRTLEQKNRSTSSEKKSRKEANTHRYPKRQELEDSKKYALLEKELKRLRAAEKQTFSTYKQLKHDTTKYQDEDQEYDMESITTDSEQHQHEFSLETQSSSEGYSETNEESGSRLATSVTENVLQSRRIEYTHEEMKCNDLMMQMEGDALEQVKREAIDAHSAALKERATLQESLRKLDDRLVAVTMNLRTAHLKTTTLTALKKTAEGILRDEKRYSAIKAVKKDEIQALQKLREKKVQETGNKELDESEMFKMEQDEDNENPQTMDVSTQTFMMKQLGDMEQEVTDIPHPSTGQPETMQVPANKHVRRQLSPLSRHYLRDPRVGNNNVNQTNLNLFLANEQKKMKVELLEMLTEYLYVLEAMVEANHPRPGVCDVLERMYELLPSLHTYDAEYEQECLMTPDIVDEEKEEKMIPNDGAHSNVTSVLVPTVQIETVLAQGEQGCDDDALIDTGLEDEACVLVDDDKIHINNETENDVISELVDGELVQDMVSERDVTESASAHDTVIDSVQVEEERYATSDAQIEQSVCEIIVPVSQIQDVFICEPTQQEEDNETAGATEKFVHEAQITNENVQETLPEENAVEDPTPVQNTTSDTIQNTNPISLDTQTTDEVQEDQQTLLPEIPVGEENVPAEENIAVEDITQDIAPAKENDQDTDKQTIPTEKSTTIQDVKTEELTLQDTASLEESTVPQEIIERDTELVEGEEIVGTNIQDPLPQTDGVTIQNVVEEDLDSTTGLIPETGERVIHNITNSNLSCNFEESDSKKLATQDISDNIKETANVNKDSTDTTVLLSPIQQEDTNSNTISPEVLDGGSLPPNDSVQEDTAAVLTDVSIQEDTAPADDDMSVQEDTAAVPTDVSIQRDIIPADVSNQESTAPANASVKEDTVSADVSTKGDTVAAADESVQEDIVPADINVMVTTDKSVTNTILLDEGVQEDHFPAKEDTVQLDEFVQDVNVQENTIPVDEVMWEDTVAVNEVVQENTVPVNEVVEDTVQADEGVHENTVPVNGSVQEDTVPVDEGIRKDTIPVDEIVCLDTVPVDAATQGKTIQTVQTLTNIVKGYIETIDTDQGEVETSVVVETKLSLVAKVSNLLFADDKVILHDRVDSTSTMTVENTVPMDGTSVDANLKQDKEQDNQPTQDEDHTVEGYFSPKNMNQNSEMTGDIEPDGENTLVEDKMIPDGQTALDEEVIMENNYQRDKENGANYEESRSAKKEEKKETSQEKDTTAAIAAAPVPGLLHRFSDFIHRSSNNGGSGPSQRSGIQSLPSLFHFNF